jgi:Uncharacterized protein conserved in bacteria (DUF2188)
MARSVKITTPVPTLEEFGKRIGLSKSRQRALAPVFIERRPQGDYAVTRRGSEKAIKVLPTQREAVEKAREVSPNGTILVERVRATTGTRDKWRRA